MKQELMEKEKLKIYKKQALISLMNGKKHAKIIRKYPQMKLKY